MSNIYWEAQDFKYKEKTVNWYWCFWSIVILVIFLTYYLFEDIFFSLLVFFLSILVNISWFKKPLTKKYSIEDDIIFMRNETRRIPFSEIESYNIDLDNMKILINNNITLQPLIQIPFEKNQNISKIDKFLSTKIKKDPNLRIPFIELFVGKLIGF